MADTQKFIDPASNLPYGQREVSANATAALHTRTLVHTASGAFTITAPAAPNGSRVGFAVTDADGSAGTNPITISGGNFTIDGAASVVLGTANQTLAFVFDGTEWKQVPPFWAATPLVAQLGAGNEFPVLPPPILRAADVRALVGSGSKAAGAGWGTVLDVDFSALPTQSLTANGTYTIGGIAGWQRQNQANDGATPMAITNGSGLVIAPKTGASYSGATRDAPLLWLPFSSFCSFSQFDWDVGIRILWQLASSNAAANGDTTFCGFDTNSMIYGMAAGRNFNGADTRALCNINVNNATTQTVSAAITGDNLATSGVFAMHCPFALQNSPSVEAFRTGTPMPQYFAKMQPAVTTVVSNFVQTNIVPFSTSALDTLGLVILAVGTTNFAPVIKRVRVDLRIAATAV